MTAYKTLRWAYWLTGGMMIVAGILPLFVWVFHLGSVLLCLGGGVVLCGGFFVCRKSRTKRSAIVMTVFLAFILIFLGGYTVLWTHYAYRRPPAAAGKAIVVVLGCKIYGEEPSSMLRQRLDRAVLYLQANPEAVCIPSGGVGAGESHSEAMVMRNYLLKQGISAERIFPEESSTNTESNLENSIDLARKNNLTGQLITCSNNFHQLRATLYAKRYGEDSRAISSRTPPLVLPSYAIRELGGILKFLVTR